MTENTVPTLTEAELEKVAFLQANAQRVAFLENEVKALKSAIHQAHGLLVPFRNSFNPSVFAVRETLRVLQRHL